MKENKSKKISFGTKLFYGFLCLIVSIVIKLVLGFKLREDEQVRSWRKSKQSYVILSAHPSEADAAVLLAALFPRYARFVVGAQQLYKEGIFGWLLRTMHVIPKRQFTNDVPAIKEMIQTVRDGYVLAMMPEGRVSMDGTENPIDPSTVKLLKKLKVPVAILIPEGTFFIRPSYHWNAIKLGKINGEIRCLFTAEDLENMSAEEMEDRINKEFRYNAFEQVKGSGNTYGSKKKPAMEHVSNLFYRCPECSSMYTVGEDGDVISCSSCGFTVNVSRELFFESPSGESIPENAAVWNKAQIEFEKEFWKADDAALEFTVEKQMLKLRVDQDFRTVCSGTLVLDKTGMRYTDEQEEIEVPLAVLPGVSADYMNGRITYYQGDDIRRFQMEDVHYPARFINSLMVLKGFH